MQFLNGYTATMQSSDPGYKPSNGIDGNTGGGMNLAHSNGAGTNVWWQVDLGADSVVSEIKLHNRMDHNCGWRTINENHCSMSEESGPGVTLGVSSTPCTGTDLCGGTVCANITRKSEMSGFHLSTVSCPANTTGRFVYVQLPGPNRLLNFAELQVAFADYVAPVPVILSQHQAQVAETEFKATDMSAQFQCDPVDRDVTDAACYGDRYAELKAEPYTLVRPLPISGSHSGSS